MVQSHGIDDEDGLQKISKNDRQEGVMVTDGR